MLKYAFLIQIGLSIFLFFLFKLFISSWSLWSNSTQREKSTGWKIPKRVCVDVLNTVIEFDRKHKREWIQMLKVKSELFCSSLRYIAWLEETLNLHEVAKIRCFGNLKIVKLEWQWKFSFFSETGEIRYLQETKKNANAGVWCLRFGCLRSTINVYYFFCMFCRNFKIWPMKKKTIISWQSCNIQSLHTFNFFSIIMRTFLN